jgi:neutral ceramidase
MKLGFAERIVTPPVGTWLGGFSSRTEPSQGVRDDLRAQAAWLQSSDFELVLVVLDQVGITQGWTDALQKRLFEAWGLNADQVLVHWTHTHCAPLYREPTPGFEHAVFSTIYFETLLEDVLEVCRMAKENLEPVMFSFGSGSCDLAVSRRLIVDGENQFAANPFAVVDHEVPVLAAIRPDGSSKLILFSYGCHPTMTNNLLFSAEYPGVARRVIESRISGVRVMFLQGCGADAVVGVHSSEKQRYLLDDQWEDMEAAGRILAWKVLLILAHQMEPVSGNSLSSSTISRNLSFEHFPGRTEIEEHANGAHLGDARWARYQLQRFQDEPVWPRGVEARFHGLRIGDVYIVGHPGEVTSAYGLRLKERHPRMKLITLGYCHSQIGYIPRRSMYDEGGYEVDAWRTWGYPSRWDRSIEQLFESTAEAVISRLL